jgi:hypothetical protein
MAGSSPAAQVWAPRGMPPHALTAHALTGLAFAQRLALGIADCVSAAPIPGGGRARGWGLHAKPDERCVARLESHDDTARHPQSGSGCDHINRCRWVYHNWTQGEARVIPDDYAALRNKVCDRVARGSCTVAFSNRSISEFKIERACDKRRAQAKGADRQ